MADLIKRPKFLTTYKEKETDEILITIQENVIPAGSEVEIIFRVLLTYDESTITPTLNIWSNQQKYSEGLSALYSGSTTASVQESSNSLVRSWN